MRAQMKIEEVDNGDKVEITTVGQKEELERFVQVCVRGCTFSLVCARVCLSQSRSGRCMFPRSCMLSLTLVCAHAMGSLVCARYHLSLV